MWSMPDDTQPNEFGKFIRYFSTRLIQSVVQARLGRSVEQPCSAQPDQSDWFNTKVDELGEIAAHIRQSVPKYPPLVTAVTLEFLLYTSEGQYLPLEAWQISVDDERDTEVNIRTELYHQLGTLLRSIIGAARVTPMYRYFVRKQGEDSFVILYRVFEGNPSADLGEDSKNFRLAELASPYGTLNVDLFYRTKMEIPIKKDRELFVKSEITPSSVTPHIILPPCRPTSMGHLPHALERQKVAARPSFSDAIPVAGGDSEQVSPVTNHVLGFFEASPAQSECSGPAPRTRFRLGRSTSSEESANISEAKPEINPMSPLPVRERRDNDRSSLFGSRLRNNSFPFAALLTQSQMPMRPTCSKRNSICIAPSETVIEERCCSEHISDESSNPLMEKAMSSNEITQSSNVELDNDGQDSVFESKGESSVQSGNNVCFRNNEDENDNDDDAPEPMDSSDESFVKVFAFSSNENLGNDLGALLKEFRLAPQQLHDYSEENAELLRHQINEFSSYAPDFDAFVRRVSEQSE